MLKLLVVSFSSGSHTTREGSEQNRSLVTLVTFGEVAPLFSFLSGAATLGGWREAGAEGEEWIARIR